MAFPMMPQLMGGGGGGDMGGMGGAGGGTPWGLIIRKIGEGLKGAVAAGEPGRAKAAEQSGQLLRDFSPSGLAQFWNKVQQNPTLKNRFLQYLQQGSLNRRKQRPEGSLTEAMPAATSPPPQPSSQNLWAGFPQQQSPQPMRQNPWAGSPWGI